jgi:hypothetical protein
MWDWISGLLQGPDFEAEELWSAFLYLVGVLVEIFKFLYTLILLLVQWLYGLIKSIGAFFVTLWNDFFKGIFSSLWAAILKVHDWLESILSPIVKFLTQVRAWVDWFFNTYVKPFLNLLSQIRNFLNILRSFGIKWAATLDAFLGKVQADIAGTFLKIQGYLNAVIGIVASITDPLGLLRRPTFVMSMRRIFPSFARGLTGLPLGYFLPSPQKGVGTGLGPLPLNFNPGDPLQNPPASGFLGGDDGLGDFGGWDGTDPLPDDTMDDMQPLPYFVDDDYPSSPCNDAASCAAAAFAAQLAAQVATS